jgi:hypothetical protein
MYKRKPRTYVHFGPLGGVKHQESLGPSRRLSLPPDLPPPTSARTSIQEVLGMARAHVNYETPAGPQRASDQPNFDDLSLYDVSDEERNKLWECEVKRLAQAVQNMEVGLEFKHSNSFAEPDTEAAYENLSTLADQLLVNLHICRHDNEVVFLQFSDKNRNSWAYNNSLTILDDRLDNPKSPLVLSREATISRSFMTRYCALVDYITVVAARLAVSSADHASWQSRALGGLAKYSAKLKILARDSEEYALRSLERGKRHAAEKNVMKVLGISQMGLDSSLAQQPAMGVAEPRFVPWSHSIDDSRRTKELEAFLQRDDPSRDFYFSDMALINRWTSSTLLLMLQELKGSSLSGHAVDGLDICSVVYRAGNIDSPLPVFVQQDRGGELSGSSNPNFIRHCYLGFNLVQQVVAEMQKRNVDNVKVGQNISGGDDRPSGTSVVTQMLEGDADETTKPVEIPLTTLAQVIAVMVPLLCTLPSVIQELQSSLQGLSELLAVDADELRPRAPDFTAVASLRTKTFERQSSSCLPGADFRSLSKSLVAQKDRHAAHPKGPTTTNTWEKTPVEWKKQRIQEVKQRRENLAKAAREWVMEEKAVRVRCPKYVYAVLTICAILVIGGLMIGIFLGKVEQGSIVLQGVDPFGIATFAWVVAGFIILVAKSIRVYEWPWRDFLLRRVTCRSLSELRAVTGANEQDLLVYLLTKESENVLITKGPYNKMFTRKGDDGFSIDVKPEVGTLVASGLIFVKVSMSRGTALVCLDLRIGSEKREVRTAIRHSDGMRDRDLVCRYPPRSGDKIQDVEVSQGQLDFLNIRWRKVLGIYHSHERKVR